MTGIDPIVRAAVHIIADRLTTEELMAVNAAAYLRIDPRPVRGYGKAHLLFTENAGRHMRADTQAVFEAVVQKRLTKKKERTA